MAFGADTAQRFQAIHVRHHHVEHGDRVLSRQRIARPCRAIVGAGDAKAFLLQVFLEHADQLNVIINKQDCVHAPIIAKRTPAEGFPGKVFTRIYITLTPLYSADAQNDVFDFPSRSRSMKRVILVSLLVAAAGYAAAMDGVDGPPRGPMMDHPGPMGGPPGGFGPGGRGPGGFHGLNLSEAQQDKLFAIHHAQEPQRREQEKAVRKAREALRALVDGGQFDEGKASTLAQAEGKAIATLSLMRARTQAQVQAVLTAEQRTQLSQDGEGRGPRRD
jgi:Spy/CpxP family protein refolding chaperone